MASSLTYLKLCAIIATVTSELQKISPTDNVADHDNFGWSVSIYDQYFAVGAHASQNAASYGTVRIFTADPESNWTQSTTLFAADGTIGDLFGYSVAIYDAYILIGAHKDDDNGADSGSAYIYARVSNTITNTWTLIQKLTASDGASSDHFGRALSIYDTYAAIGAAEHDANGINSGAVYIFEGVATIWSQSAKLLPNNGSANDNFGCSVSIYDTFVVAGAYSADEAGTDSGSAYVFERNNNNWVQHTKLVPNDGAASDWFGISVSIYSTYIIVGACYKDSYAGSAYIFTYNDTLNTWSQSAKLVPNDTIASQQFGRSVSIHGAYAVIGTYESPIGSAYVFELDEVHNVWTQRVKLVPSDGVDYDKFGHAVANYDNNIVIGAPYVDDKGVNAGSVYVTAITETSVDITTTAIHDLTSTEMIETTRVTEETTTIEAEYTTTVEEETTTVVVDESTTNAPEATTTDAMEDISTTTTTDAGSDPKSEATRNYNTVFVMLIYCVLLALCI